MKGHTTIFGCTKAANEKHVNNLSNLSFLAGAEQLITEHLQWLLLVYKFEIGHYFRPLF